MPRRLLPGVFFCLSCLAAGQSLDIEAWQLSCSSSNAEDINAALRGAALRLKPCGIKLNVTKLKALEALPAWCDLPPSEKRRRPLLKGMAAGRARRHSARSLSLFIVPGGSQERYAFSLIDVSAGADCGSPQDSARLREFGSLFITDFTFLQHDPDFNANLLTHEIAHVLTMHSHPTHAPRGSFLADHIADIGPRPAPGDCECMRLSPYLKP